MLILTVIFLSIFLSYSIYFYLNKAQRSRQGQFQRNFVTPPKELLRKDLDPAGVYYFAGKDENSIWLGNEKAPLELLTIAIDKGFSVIGKTLPIRASFERGQLAYVNYPFYIFINGRKRLVQSGMLTSSQPIHTDTISLSFDVAGAAADSAFWLRVSTDKGFQLGYYKLGHTLKETSALTTRGLSALSRDGILLYDERMHLSAYVYFYRNSFLLFDKEGKASKAVNTIDTVSFAQVDLGKPDMKGTRRKNTSTQSINYRADISNSYMYIYSRARTSAQADVNRDSIVIDAYAVNENRYVYSFLVLKKFNNEVIQDLRIVYPYIFLLVKTKVIILKM